ncbi:hypothetical protein [Streptacidiphilus cavernicola]|uniref:Uncharacterized protein n=1 Tax=Streptacidiphilus cavernicola TaxID=3342716 RepID=A0ABV6VY90_9ACTN
MTRSLFTPDEIAATVSAEDHAELLDQRAETEAEIWAEGAWLRAAEGYYSPLGPDPRDLYDQF